MMRWLALVVPGVLAGCYAPSPPEGAACTDNGECPRPLVCDVDNVCKKTRSDAPAATDDAPPADGPDGDAPMPDAAAVACASAPTGAWTNRMPIMVSGPGLDGTPSLTPDGLELFWKSDRGGNQDLWHAVRPNLSSSWSPAMAIDELNTPLRDGSPEISADGLTLYFASERSSGMATVNDIFVAKRPSRSQPFGAPVLVTALSSAADEEGFTMNAAGTVGYLHSDRNGGTYHIFRMTRATPTDAWSTPVEVSELTDADYENPWVSADDCRMYVQSPRTGSTGPADLWMAKRPAPGMPFGAPVNVSPPSGPGFQGDPWVSSDEKTLVYVEGGANLSTFDLFYMTR